MELTLYYLIIFVASLCTTWWIFTKVLHIAKLKNIVDTPGERKLQRVPVPVMGGITVFFGMTVAFATAGTIYDLSSLFAMICVICFILSGKSGLYASQLQPFSKETPGNHNLRETTHT